ncbi:MAG: Hpt domain-containing protein [Woeseiaceae bacterium]|nr:Hpt domain-containing protein [Woeseiaceae bacterium]
MDANMMIMSSDSDKPIDISDPFARQLMARYLQRRDADISALRNALKETEFEKIRITGHNMFGSGAAYGLDEISRLGQNIEDAAEEGDSARLTGLISDLEHYLKALKIV